MNLEKYRTTIGIERLNSFGLGNENITEEFLIKMYELNIKISQAFYPVLSIVEIQLRNAIDTMIQTVFSSTWLEDELKTQKLLLDYDYNKLQKAYKALKNRYGEVNITHGKIVAELTIGFWVSLCSKKYNSIIWTKKGAFKGVFINYPKDKLERIHDISSKLTKIKNLRNRIFHHEPILYKKDKIGVMYNIICEIISYLPKDDSNILNRTNNFPNEISKMLQIIDSAKQKL